MCWERFRQVCLYWEVSISPSKAEASPHTSEITTVGILDTQQQITRERLNLIIQTVSLVNKTDRWYCRSDENSWWAQMNEKIMLVVSVSQEYDSIQSQRSYRAVRCRRCLLVSLLHSVCTSPTKPVVTLVVSVGPRWALCVFGQGTVELQKAIDTQITK